MPQESVKSNARMKTSVREIVLCGMFAAITAVLSQISIPIGPVPISCSWIAVFLTGLLLPMRPAVLSQIVYLLLGTVGVPVFAGFQSGVARLAGPTGGYLLAYPIMVLILCAMMKVYDKKLADKAMGLRALFLVGALILSAVVCYASGTAWFTVFSGSSFEKALTLTVLPFLAGDAAKIALCTVLTLSARPQLKKVMQGKGK